MNKSIVRKNIDKINADYAEYGIDLRLEGGKVYLHGKSLDQWHRDMWLAIAENPEINLRHYVLNNLSSKIYDFLSKEYLDTYWCPDVFAWLYSAKLNDGAKCEYCPLKHEDSAGCCDGLFEVYDDMEFNYRFYPDSDSLEWVKRSSLDMANHEWIWE